MKATEKSQDSTRPSAQRPYATRVNFGTGLLAGAALSTLVPWEVLGAAAPSARLACLASLGAAFVALRFLFSGAEVRKATSVAMVAVGGLLMSAGAKIMPSSMALSPVGVGAVCFLFGITLLLRERRLPKDVRDQAIGRLLENPNATAQEGLDAEVRTAKSIERLQSLQLLAETQSQEAPKRFMTSH